MMQRAAFISLCVLCVLGCSSDPAGEPVSIVLVTIDTLRADRLGCYGGNVATPHLDRLAREGSLFMDPTAQSPLTLPSHSSILTGTNPTYHGVKDNGRYRLPDAIDTLAEVLKKKGYATAAFVGGFPVHSRFGLNQGFDIYDEHFSRSHATLAFAERRGEAVVAAANNWLESHKNELFFMWIHVFDPHAPYDPPEPFRSQYAAPYDGEVAYVDKALGSLFSVLGEDVLTVVTSDHGEGLGEHGEPTHSLFIYDSTLSVPLIFHGPGIPRGAVIREQVRTIDILPTLLELVGQPDDCGACQGESLVARMRGEDAAPTPSYAETYFPRLNLGWSELRSLRREGWKYIAAPEPELYDLSRDPGELENLAKSEPERLEELAAELSALEDATAGPASSSAMTPDRETLTLLRSLGYVSTDEPPRAEGPLPDPKSRLPVWQTFRQGMEHVSKGEFDQAIRQFEAVLRQDPQFLLARSYLSGAFYERSRYEDAARQCGMLLKDDPTHFEAMLLLGKSLARMGRAQEAEGALQHAAELDASSAGPLAELANLFLQQGNPSRARQSLIRARERDAEAPSVLLVQGKILLAEGKPEEAERSLRNALAANPSEEEPRVQLANLLLGQRRLEEAERLVREGLAQRPQSASLHLGLGHSRALAGKMDQAIESFEKAFELAPNSTLVMNSLGFAYLEVDQAEKGIELLELSLETNPNQPELKSFLLKLRAR